MATIRLYIDADVHGGLASLLRREGYDAVDARESGHQTMSDPAIFQFAAKENRAVLTFNIRHFVPLAKTALSQNQPFSGVIVSHQIPFRETRRRILRLLSMRQQEDIDNSIVWLNNYR